MEGKIELLAPAGNLEKLEMALIYGADAVYIGGEQYGLRAYADNFSIEDMKKGIEFAHSMNKKVYVTLNIIAHNEDLEGLDSYVRTLADMGADAVIISDPGVYSIVREAAPGIKLHLSTQANNTNWRSVKFWNEQGFKRIILARELSLEEIWQIRQKAYKDVELEIFIHGAMCISYSGRCLLSNYMAGRDSNRGLCAHPCRWKYYLVEEKRPGEYLPVEENEQGTFILNSKDLCMIEHIPEIVKSGVSSVKIEGRMKSSYYVATVVKAYRTALDSYFNDPERYKFNPEWMEEISKASHREFTTGFYSGMPDDAQNYTTSSYIRNYSFVGVVKGYDERTGVACVEQRNKMIRGEEIEVVSHRGGFFRQIIEDMKDVDGNDINEAPHPQMTVYMQMDKPVEQYAILRRRC
jgi:U32 family peptidase